MLTRFGLSVILRESLMAGNFVVMASTEVMILVVMAVIFMTIRRKMLFIKLCQDTYNFSKVFHLLITSLINHIALVVLVMM